MFVFLITGHGYGGVAIARDAAHAAKDAFDLEQLRRAVFALSFFGQIAQPPAENASHVTGVQRIL
jgi:hypothetical protein